MRFAYFIRDAVQVIINLPLALVIYPIAYIIGRAANWARRGFEDAF